MDITGAVLVGFVSFIRHVSGLIVRPYETSRRIADRAHATELLFIAIVLAAYFALASIVKTAAFRPLMLTRQFVVLFSGAGLMYMVTAITLWKVSTWVGGTGSFRRLAVSWAYTLIPTTLWFLATSLLYVILPPPRTTSMLGIIFSLIYLLFSSTLFFWKIILAYLSLRFAMRLDLAKIGFVTVASAPVIIASHYFLYRLGIFKVPFL